MVLGAALEDADGVSHEMTGLLSHQTSFAKRRLHLGYRALRLGVDGILGNAGAQVKGHEFHYASVTDAGSDDPLGMMTDGVGTSLGEAGGRRGRVSGTFFHAVAAAR